MARKEIIIRKKYFAGQVTTSGGPLEKCAAKSPGYYDPLWGNVTRETYDGTRWVSVLGMEGNFAWSKKTRDNKCPLSARLDFDPAVLIVLEKSTGSFFCARKGANAYELTEIPREDYTRWNITPREEIRLAKNEGNLIVINKSGAEKIVTPNLAWQYPQHRGWRLQPIPVSRF